MDLNYSASVSACTAWTERGAACPCYSAETWSPASTFAVLSHMVDSAPSWMFVVTVMIVPVEPFYSERISPRCCEGAYFAASWASASLLRAVFAGTASLD